MKKLLILIMSCALLSGCAASSQYIKPEDSVHTYSKSYDQVMDAIPAAVEKAKMKLIEVRREDGVVDVVAPPSFWTSSLGNLMKGGDKVTVTVRKVSDNSASVEVVSQSVGEIVDFGRSARVVGTLFKKLDEILI